MYISDLESQGLRSDKVQEFLKTLEDNRLTTHDMIIARNGEIVFEKYWEPFDEKFLHRMYSVTKSFVALAVGCLLQDGLVKLDDPISRYFPKECANQTDPNMLNQTIRHMLMMSTGKWPRSWFAHRTDDRVQFYFDNPAGQSRPSGTLFQYDSEGSFILGALVERLTGENMLDYLRRKALDKIGFSKEPYILKCPGGHSWADSGLLCTPRDLLKVAQLTMNYGSWNGEQLMDEEYLRTATSYLIATRQDDDESPDAQGYGYYIWRNYHDSFFFNGMGGQFALCVPSKQLIFIYNGDNQGRLHATKVIFDSFFKLVYETAADVPLPANTEAKAALDAYAKDLKLAVAVGETESPWQEKLNGITYTMDENPMGITKFTLHFEGKKGVFAYTNAQGDKELAFGLGYNEFGPFPQDGYSDMVGSKPGDIHYHTAVSAVWQDPHKLYLKVQVIDKYFGVLHITLSFREDGLAGVYMVKTAEDFFEEYQGFGCGHRIEE